MRKRKLSDCRATKSPAQLTDAIVVLIGAERRHKARKLFRSRQKLCMQAPFVTGLLQIRIPAKARGPSFPIFIGFLYFDFLLTSLQLRNPITADCPLLLQAQQR